MPNGLVQAGARKRWSDVHPGMRFAQSLVLLKSWGTATPIPNDRDELDVTWRTLQSKLCEAFGWPTPDELAQAWLKNLRQEEVGTACFMPRAVRAGSVAFLELRSRAPGNSTLNNVNFIAERTPRCPLWIVQTERMSAQLEGIPVGETDGHDLLDRLAISKCLRYLLFPRNLDPCILDFDQPLRERAFVLLAREAQAKVRGDLGASLTALASALEVTI